MENALVQQVLIPDMSKISPNTEILKDLGPP